MQTPNTSQNSVFRNSTDKLLEKRFDGPGKSWNLLSVKVWELWFYKYSVILRFGWYINAFVVQSSKRHSRCLTRMVMAPSQRRSSVRLWGRLARIQLRRNCRTWSMKLMPMVCTDTLYVSLICIIYSIIIIMVIYSCNWSYQTYTWAGSRNQLGENRWVRVKYKLIYKSDTSLV